jgi:hypothetical protein
MEKRIKYLRQVERWNEIGRKTVPLVEVVELLIPCVLHLENRFNHFMGTSSSDLAATNFISSVQDVIQKQVLRTQVSPSQWKLKWSKTADGIKIDNVQLRNQVA